MNQIINFLKSIFKIDTNPSSIGKAVVGKAASIATGVATGLVMKEVTNKMVEGEMKKAQQMQADAMKQAGMAQSNPQNQPNQQQPK